jgi:fatty acid desaturase
LDDARGMPARAERQLLTPERLRRIRVDGALTLLWLGTCTAAYGGAAWVLLLVVLGRGAIVSFMDNAPHYGGKIADPAQGYDMRAPAPIATLVLNTNLHGTHHRNPNLPWTALPQAFAAEAGRYAGSYLLLPWRQLRGPLPATMLVRRHETMARAAA